MRRPKTTALSALLLSAFLTACAGTDPTFVQRIYLRQRIPPSLLICAPDPAVPATPVTEFAVLEYVARLRAALLDCHYRLDRVAALVRAEASPGPQ